jgi:succinate dehydrogenase/fumarate reductase-like Fe-S protein
MSLSKKGMKSILNIPRPKHQINKQQLNCILCICCVSNCDLYGMFIIFSSVKALVCEF